MKAVSDGDGPDRKGKREMQTTITEFTARPCTRCAGSRFISQFQHRKGGECFRCGASGIDPQMIETTRDMTDAEVLAALADAGFPVMFTERAETGNFLTDLFPTADEMTAHAATMAGARLVLAAI
jgi:hypothetical protein